MLFIFLFKESILSEKQKEILRVKVAMNRKLRQNNCENNQIKCYIQNEQQTTPGYNVRKGGTNKCNSSDIMNTQNPLQIQIIQNYYTFHQNINFSINVNQSFYNTRPGHSYVDRPLTDYK